MTRTGDRMAETLRAKLAAAFEPDHLEVIDESEQHRGHAGWREGGGTHFRVVMRAAAPRRPQPRRAQPRRAQGARPTSSPAACTPLALDLAGEPAG